MMWIQFDSQASRDDSIKKFAKSSFKFKSQKIWAEKDLKYSDRQLISLLLGIRKDFIDRKLEKRGIWIAKESFSLYYFDDMVIQLNFEDSLQCNFGVDWASYLCEGNFEELKSNCADRITKGNGKGKGK